MVIPLKSRKKTVGWWWKLYSQLSPDFPSRLRIPWPTEETFRAHLIDLLPRCQGRRPPGDAGDARNDAQREAKPGRHGGEKSEG